MHSIQLNHIRLDKPSLNEECKQDKRAFSLTSLHVAMAGSREAMTMGSLWDHLMASQVAGLLAEEAINDKQLSHVLRTRLFRVRVVV